MSFCKHNENLIPMISLLANFQMGKSPYKTTVLCPGSWSKLVPLLELESMSPDSHPVQKRHQRDY